MTLRRSSHRSSSPARARMAAARSRSSRGNRAAGLAASIRPWSAARNDHPTSNIEDVDLARARPGKCGASSPSAADARPSSRYATVRPSGAEAGLGAARQAVQASPGGLSRSSARRLSSAGCRPTFSSWPLSSVSGARVSASISLRSFSNLSLSLRMASPSRARAAGSAAEGSGCSRASGPGVPGAPAVRLGGVRPASSHPSPARSLPPRALPSTTCGCCP
mmetsp:Transcript_757/g.2214  ORF Transcript_757/g.2214 Transcript_757/m.2214 type:complete len:221 (+) Transcript_757:161-823(+)